MNGVDIRKARMEDIDVLLGFEQAMIEAERPFDRTIKRGPTNYYDLPELIVGDNVELLIAECEGHPIGCGYARIEKAKPYHDHSHHSYLGFMYVVPGQRGKGINSLIVDALFQWSRDRGVNEVVLEVYSDNLAAIRAYQKAGFTADLVTMRAKLDRT